MEKAGRIKKSRNSKRGNPKKAEHSKIISNAARKVENENRG